MLLSLALTATLVTGCISSRETGTPAAGSSTECPEFVLRPLEGTTPIITSSELVVGRDRFAFALEREGQLLEGATVRVGFFAPCKPDAPQQTLDAAWRGLSSKEQDHTHADGELHSEPGGIYAVGVSFDREGQWLAEFTIGEAEPETVKVMFSVRAQGSTPPIGAPAPRSQTAVLAPGGNIQQIDTSRPPHPEMLQISIADAIAQKKPSLVVFATPAFCKSRVCGPVFEEVALLYPEYAGRVTFIHVEPYELDAQGQPVLKDNNFVPVASMTEWGFPSEPWVVLIDANGNVAAKFEGLTNRDEVAQAIDAMLG